MANSTKNTKQSTFLTLGEKIQIFEHRDSNPKDSFEDCIILELVQPEEITVAVPTPSANQRMTKKKSLTSSVNSNKE